MSTPDHSFLFVTYIHTLGSFSNDDGDGKNLSAVLKKSTPEKFSSTCHFQQIGINATKKGEFILKLTFSLPLPSPMLKLPIVYR